MIDKYTTLSDIMCENPVAARYINELWSSFICYYRKSIFYFIRGCYKVWNRY